MFDHFIPEPCFMLVAGELSGDGLGAGLIQSLKEIYPQARFFGVGGPLMIAAGLESIAPMEPLSIMGLFEVITSLPTLLRLKKELVQAALLRQPSAFIGIDAPDFNLRLAKDLKAQSIKTFQYVSPSIWVWREGRVHGIKRVIDCVLCLFPFEVTLYHKYGVDAVCVGHSLADAIDLQPDVEKARYTLEISSDHPIITLLPGSRVGEVKRLIIPMLQSMLYLIKARGQMECLISAATPTLALLIDAALATLTNEQRQYFRVIEGQALSRTAMIAADAVLLASGTVSLEALLLKKPMVVIYKMNALTAWLAPKLIKSPYFSLPNILAGQAIVPELFQKAVEPKRVSEALIQALDPQTLARLLPIYHTIHQNLRLNANQMAANTVVQRLSL